MEREIVDKSEYRGYPIRRSGVIMKYWIPLIAIATIIVGLIVWGFSSGNDWEIWLLVILFLIISVVLWAPSSNKDSDTN